MAEKGIFRSAMRGFNKHDVLEYIDGITGAWDAERRELEQQAAVALAAAEELRATAEQAQAQAAEALQQAQLAQTQLAEVQQQLYDTTADLAASRDAAEALDAQLLDTQQKLAELEGRVTVLTDERDEAIAAVADAREQLASQSATAADAAALQETTERRLKECHQYTQRQDEQINALQKAIGRYEAVLGNAETAHQHVDGIVRPFIEQANRQADETLDSVQAVLAGLLAQLGELQGNVEQRRQALRRCKMDSDSRLSAAFGDWLGQARDATAPTAAPDRYFFR